MNVTIIVSLITAISAIFSPMITSWINNRYQLKMKKLEIYEERKIEVIEKYLKSTSQYLSLVSSRYESEYNASYGEIYLYTPSYIWPKLETLHSYISPKSSGNKSLISARNLFPEISKELSKYLALG